MMDTFLMGEEESTQIQRSLQDTGWPWWKDRISMQNQGLIQKNQDLLELGVSPQLQEG